MKKIALPFLFAISLVSIAQEINETITVDYIKTNKVDTITNYFGTNVEDPYRWLEDDRSKETEAWVENQNEVTFNFLDKIPFRDELKDRLTALWNYEKVGSPFKEGNYTYYYKNDGLQNQYVIYRYKTVEDPSSAKVFLDPNTFKEDGTISLAGLSFSDNGKVAAYSISIGGSDWRKVLVMNTETKKIIEDTLIDIKFSGLSWKENDGFYYSSYDKPEGSELTAKTDQHKLFYHKIGTIQTEDELIFGGIPSEKHRYVRGRVSEDNTYLTVSASISTSGNKLFIKDLRKPNSPLIPILDHTDSNTYLLDNSGTTLYLVTDLNAPNKKIITVDFKDPTPENWVDFIPETEHVLSPSRGGGNFFIEYMIDAVSKVMQYDYDGNLIRNIELPGIGTINGFRSKKEEKEMYFSFTNYITPGSIFKYNIANGTSELYRSPKIDFNPDNYESKQIFYSPPPRKLGTA